jgi:arginine-tRNA-protein transferase
MSRRKSWPEKLAEPFDYYLTFVHGRQEFGREILYLLGDRLVMVALVDVLPRSLSAVYTFYDPALRKRSLGVYSVLRQIDLARTRALPHVYLGYWVEGNASMRYKARYQPHEILVGRPELNERPRWETPS